MVRKPIITRTPIVSSTTVFQTIASHSDNYENSVVMGTYPSVEIARSHYMEDIDKYRANGYKHYAIRRVNNKEE